MLDFIQTMNLDLNKQNHSKKKLQTNMKIHQIASSERENWIIIFGRPDFGKNVVRIYDMSISNLIYERQIDQEFFNLGRWIFDGKSFLFFTKMTQQPGIIDYNTVSLHSIEKDKKQFTIKSIHKFSYPWIDTIYIHAVRKNDGYLLIKITTPYIESFFEHSKSHLYQILDFSPGNVEISTEVNLLDPFPFITHDSDCSLFIVNSGEFMAERNFGDNNFSCIEESISIGKRYSIEHVDVIQNLSSKGIASKILRLKKIFLTKNTVCLKFRLEIIQKNQRPVLILTGDISILRGSFKFQIYPNFKGQYDVENMKELNEENNDLKGDCYNFKTKSVYCYRHKSNVFYLQEKTKLPSLAVNQPSKFQFLDNPQQ
jgi:hypothetical protein